MVSFIVSIIFLYLLPISIVLHAILTACMKIKSQLILCVYLTKQSCKILLQEFELYAHNGYDIKFQTIDQTRISNYIRESEYKNPDFYIQIKKVRISTVLLVFSQFGSTKNIGQRIFFLKIQIPFAR